MKDLLSARQVIELYRPRGDSHPFAVLAAVLVASRAWAPEFTFNRLVEKDGTRPSVIPDEAWLRDWADRLQDPFHREMFGGLVLCTSGDPPLTFSYRRDFAYGREVTETARVAIPWRPPPTWATTNRLADYVKSLALAYGASIATIIPHDLSSALYWATSQQRGLQAEFPDLEMREEELAPFLSLLPRTEIDRAAVPECLGWINVWSSAVVEQIGQERILAADWHRCETAGGGLLLVTTQDAPIRQHPGAIRELAQLVEAINLGAAQRREADQNRTL